MDKAELKRLGTIRIQGLQAAYERKLREERKTPRRKSASGRKGAHE